MSGKHDAVMTDHDEAVAATRELSVAKERVEKVIMHLKEEVTELRNSVSEKQQKVVKLMGKIEGLETGMESLSNSLKEALNKNVVLERENKKAQDELESCLQEKKKIAQEKDERIETLLKQKHGLEMDRKELVKENLCLKTDNIDLLRQVEGFETENGQLLEQNEGMEMVKREVMEKMDVLERDVITWMCLNVPRDEKLSSSPVGKILCGIIDALDSERVVAVSNAKMNKDGSFEEEDSVDSHINETERCPSPETKSEEAVRRTLVFDTEVSTKNKATSIKKDLYYADIVVLSDSDSDSKAPHTASELKRKRARSKSSSERDNDASFCDDSLNPNHKVRRLAYVSHKPEEAETSRTDHIFVSQTMVTVRKCQYNNDRSTQADECVSPQAKELIATCRRSRT